MVDVKLIFVALMVASGLLAREPMAGDVQPSTVPCKSPLQFKTTSDPVPKVVAKIGNRVLKSTVDQGLIQVTLITGEDCNQNLILTVGNSENTYSIEPLNLLDPASGLKDIRTKVEALRSDVASFQEKTLLTLGISFIALLGVLGFIVSLVMKRRSYTPSNDTAELNKQLVRIEQQFITLQTLVQSQTGNLVSQLAEIKSAKPLASLPAQMAKVYPSLADPSAPADRREEVPKVAAAAASVAGRHEQTQPKAKSEKFEDLYKRLLSEGKLSELKEKNPIVVGFENQAAMDRNPEAEEPLVRNSQGWLMLVPHEDLEKGQYYVVPSLTLNGVWRDTQRAAWRSVFNFASSDASTLSQAAIATDIGGKWEVTTKGQFS